MRSKFVEHWKHKLDYKLYSEIKQSYTPEKYLNNTKNDKYQLKQAPCNLRSRQH